MKKTRCVTRRELIAGATAAAGALALSPVGTAGAAELPADVAAVVSYLYIDCAQLSVGDEQSLVVSLADGVDAASLELAVVEEGTGARLALEPSRQAGTATLFTLVPESAGTYLVDSLTLTASDGTARELSLADVDGAYRSFVASDAVATLSADGETETHVYAPEGDSGVTEEATLAGGLAAARSVSAGPSARSGFSMGEDGILTVALDPGHGGYDQGANAGKDFGPNTEAYCTWKISQACADELARYSHVRVVLTRELEDENNTIEQRVLAAVEQGADVIVSQHINSASAGAYGAEVWVPSGEDYNYETHEVGQALGEEILEELEALGLYNRGTKIRTIEAGSSYDYPDGSAGDYYGIIRYARRANMPGIIVEHAFISNTSDYEEFLSSDEKLAELGRADARGIAEAYGLSLAADDELSAVFDPTYYLANNADVARVYGVGNAIEHFRRYGMNEGRQGCAGFDPAYYRNANADLRPAFGSTMMAYYYHYVDQGRAAGRPGTGSAQAVVTLWRLYNPYTGQHLYTKDDGERNLQRYYGWDYEGVAWEAPEQGSPVVYRLYNSFSGDHHYTTDEEEYDRLGRQGWKREGEAWCSAPQSGRPLYRLFNPYAQVGTHHYTLNASERDQMVEDGWKYEGVAWYGL